MSDINELEGMYKELRDLANSIKEDAFNTANRLSVLIQTREKLRNTVDKLELLVADMKETTYLQTLLDTLKKDVQETASESLALNAKAAAESSEEYSRQPLLNLLIRACKERDSVTIKLISAGWNSTIDVQINLDQTGGTLEDWGRAVEDVRIANDWTKTKDPIQASALWRDSIFLHHQAEGKRGKRFVSSNRWLYTIEERLNYAAQTAPFWRLLNYGNMVQSLSSDKGGLPYPKNGPTMFVENTQEQLRAEFSQLLALAKQDFEAFGTRATGLKTALSNLSSELDKIESNLEEKLSKDLDRIQKQARARERADEARERLTNKVKSVVSSYGLSADFSSSSRLIMAIDELSYFGKFINTKVTKAGRIEITVKGGARKRIYVSKLQRIFSGLE